MIEFIERSNNKWDRNINQIKILKKNLNTLLLKVTLIKIAKLMGHFLPSKITYLNNNNKAGSERD